MPLQSNNQIIDPNFHNNSANVLSQILEALVMTGAMHKKDADKLLTPSPFDELVKKR